MNLVNCKLYTLIYKKKDVKILRPLREAIALQPNAYTKEKVCIVVIML